MNQYHPSKRRYSDLENETHHDQTFFLQNLATNTNIAFEPLSRLLRAHLPLSWLAPTSSIPCLAPASIFQGKITYTSRWEYSVLIARHAPNGGLVVLEKFDDDCFVVHPLQPFVTDQWIQDASVGAVPSVCMQTMLHYIQEPTVVPKEEFTPILGSTGEGSDKLPKNRRGAAARISILSHQETRDASPTPTRELVNEGNIEEHESSAKSSVKEANSRRPEESSTLGHVESIEPPNVAEEEISDFLSPAYLRQRYLEHLYKSKTSLGYYTKGPLSRARARARAPDSSMPLSQLASFYRDSILPSKKMDLKYKDSVKEIVKKTSSDYQSRLETQNKSKMSRKTKLGKDGLWPNEREYVSEWWHSRVFQPKSSSEQQDVELRDALAALRIREAQMQIILILETLSIEAKIGGQGESSPVEQPKTDSKALEPDSQSIPSKSKSKHRNLESDLDILADKLCIWHSVGLESAWITADASGSKPQLNADTESTDRLRTFCIDVIMTFYNSKLPLICRSLCKTLAGSDVFEQFQKSLRVKEAASQPANTGKAIERRAPSLGSRTLERVLSEGNGRLSSPPTLLRSSTLPPVIQFKREPSDLNPRPPSRTSRQKSVSLTKREVDLIADANATTSKKRKLEMVAYAKREAEAAIQALKKPNRMSAGKTYMDEVEKRTSSTTRLAVQITATPRTNRTSSLIDCQEGIELPRVSTGDSLIPSSTVKTQGLSNMHSVPRSSATKRAVLAAMRNTPTKNADRRKDSRSFDRNVLDTPVKAMQPLPELIFATPQKMKTMLTKISSTPEKHQPTALAEEKAFTVPEIAFKTMQRAMGDNVKQDTGNDSIYDTLGWNDDYEI